MKSMISLGESAQRAWYPFESSQRVWPRPRDHHLWFTPDPPFTYLLNPENHFQGKPSMLAEITPDCPGNPPDSSAAAKCPQTRLPIPKMGDHIAIDGPWVFDTNHGWNEIHPVDAITISGQM